MANGETPLKPSVFDRLIGDLARDRGDLSRDPLPCFVARLDKFNEAELRECLMRDIGWLLNEVHLAAATDLDAYPEIATSVLNAGIEELTGKQMGAAAVEGRGRAIAATLRLFEPRLMPASIGVSVEGGGLAFENKLKYVIHARFLAELGSDYVEMTTAVDIDTGMVEVAR